MRPNTQYAAHGDRAIAYQVIGEGPIELVVVPSFVSHIEMFWADPTLHASFDRLASFSRMVMFDKLGTGLSDPVSRVPTLEDRVAEVSTVMDAAGFERAALLGTSEGGSMSVAFAAMRPERVSALVLAGVYPRFFAGGSPEQVRARYAADGIDESYWPTDEQVTRGNRLLEAVKGSWGEGNALDMLLPNLGGRHAMIERFAASPGMARATMESAALLNVTPLLPMVTAPTLIFHARQDNMIPVQGARLMANRIPNAKLLEVDGADHLPWLNSPDAVISQIEEFLTGASHVHQPDRALATILITDLVGSTSRAAQLGDTHWLSFLERHDGVTRDAFTRFGGRAVKSMGDGFIATFEGPGRAIRCAQQIVKDLAEVDLQARVGIHTGECEFRNDDIGGMAVHIAARVADIADAGEILVSRTVVDLVVGSGLGFDDRGVHTLRGVQGKWRLFAVRPGGPEPGSAEYIIGHLTTPGPQERMKVGDRLAMLLARRVPGLIRRLTTAGQSLRRR